ncbi:hypothetical protein KP509_1Z083800 [Ceratopteris richardii]|nr:hypothetical protein KP509_1Z083800 [Ceratopteris richardii]
MEKVTCMEESFVHCPKLEHFAFKRLEKLLVICKEWEELKIKERELKMKLELKVELVDLKLHKEWEEIKCKREACEMHLHAEFEDFRMKAEFVGHAINPIVKIKSGFLKFKMHFEEEKEYYEKLVECQKPKFLIFSCCNSRVDPFKILNLELGEAIVVRNVGNLIAEYGEEGSCPSNHAAIEYAVKELQILVIGHNNCDAIQSLIKVQHEQKSHFSEHFKNWVKIAEHTCEQVKELHSSKNLDEQCTLCEKECVNLSMHNVLTYPFAKEAVAARKISVRAGYYDMRKCSFDRWSLDTIDGEGETYH